MKKKNDVKKQNKKQTCLKILKVNVRLHHQTLIETETVIKATESRLKNFSQMMQRSDIIEWLPETKRRRRGTTTKNKNTSWMNTEQNINSLKLTEKKATSLTEEGVTSSTTFILIL